MQMMPLTTRIDFVALELADDRRRHHCVVDDGHESLERALIDDRERGWGNNLSCGLIAGLPDETRGWLNECEAERCREFALLYDQNELVVDILVEQQLIFG